MLNYFSVTPPENSGGEETSTENSGPHAKNFFRSMYESSLRHPVWVPEINVNPCNSVETIIRNAPKGGKPNGKPYHPYGFRKLYKIQSIKEENSR